MIVLKSGFMIERILSFIQENKMLIPGQKVVVAVSGGPDSLCLLHVLLELKAELRVELHIAHLNHGVRSEEAKEDSDFVKRLTEEWELPGTYGFIDIPGLSKKVKLSLETAAREARYLFLASVAEEVGASTIAVGHNANDQVESYLMHLLRGSGFGGLRSIQTSLPLNQVIGNNPFIARFVESPKSPLDNFQLVRPILILTREETEDYCRKLGITACKDLSNQEEKYHRSMIRNKLIPVLEKISPNFKNIISRHIQIVNEDYRYIQSKVEEIWPTIIKVEGPLIRISIAEFDKLPLSLRRYLIRQSFLKIAGNLQEFSLVNIEECLRLMAKGVGSRVFLPHGLTLLRGYDEMYLGFSNSIEAVLQKLSNSPQIKRSISITVPGINAIPDTDWRLVTRIIFPDDEPLDSGDSLHVHLALEKTGSDLVLRPRKKGDLFQPLGMHQNKKIQDFLVDDKIPRWFRDTLPLLETTGEIAWVVSLRIGEKFKVEGTTNKILCLKFENCSL